MRKPTVEIETKLRDRLKIRAVKEGTTVKALVAKAVELYLVNRRA